MAAQPPKILFDKTLFRIRMVFIPRELALSPYPQQYLIKAKERMEQLKAEKAITDFVAYERLFNELLQAPEPKRLPGVDVQNESYEVILAQGFVTNGTLKLRLEEVEQNKVIKLSILPQKPAPNFMPVEWVEAAVEAFLLRNNIQHKFDRGALRGLYLNAEKIHVEQVGSIPLYAPRLLRASEPLKPFEIRLHNADQDVSLVLHNLTPIASKEARRDLNNEIQLEIQKANRRTKQTYKILLDDLKENIRELLAGPCRFGVSLPVSFLVAKAAMPGESGYVAIAASIQQEKPIAEKVPEVVNESDPAFPLLEFEVDDEGMVANIRQFDMLWYRKYKDRISANWIQSNLKRLNLVNRDEGLSAAIQKQIEAGVDLTAFMVARGTRPEQPREPFLEMANKNKEKSEEKIDFRESGSLRLVDKDELIAQIRYKIPGKKGIDVYGKVIDFPAGDKLNVRIGSNIIEKESGKFFATEHGVVVSEDGRLSVKDSLVINGNVNLATGNIDFKGAVVVNGNIESGSTVICDGPLVVNGFLEDAFVKVKGDIKVSEGIVMAKHGRLICGGNLVVNFIQNAKISVFGNIKLRGTMLNSTVDCRGDIIAKYDNGVIGGGVVRCYGSMEVINLGFKNGTKTIVSLGAPFGVEASLHLWEKRLRGFETSYVETQKQIRELKSRNRVAHQVEKLDTALEHLNGRLQRLAKGKALATEKLHEVKQRMTYNQEATLKVRGIIHKSVALLLGGKENTRLSDISHSLFTVRPSRGRNLFQLNELPKQTG